MDDSNGWALKCKWIDWKSNYILLLGSTPSTSEAAARRQYANIAQDPNADFRIDLYGPTGLHHSIAVDCKTVEALLHEPFAVLVVRARAELKKALRGLKPRKRS